VGPDARVEALLDADAMRPDAAHPGAGLTALLHPWPDGEKIDGRRRRQLERCATDLLKFLAAPALRGLTGAARPFLAERWSTSEATGSPEMATTNLGAALERWQAPHGRDRPVGLRFNVATDKDLL